MRMQLVGINETWLEDCMGGKHDNTKKIFQRKREAQETVRREFGLEEKKVRVRKKKNTGSSHGNV
jgi:hypothetical protein